MVRAYDGWKAEPPAVRSAVKWSGLFWFALTLSVAAAGPARALTCLIGPLRAPGGAEVEGVQTISGPVAPGSRLIGAFRGLFLYADGRLQPIPGGSGISQVGPVEAISDPDATGARLVGAFHGLFRYAGGRLEPVPGGQSPREVGGIRHIGEPDSNGDRLVAAFQGLFRYTGGRLEIVSRGRQIGSPRYIGSRQRDGAQLVGASGGLFRYDRGRLDPVSGGDRATMVEYISPANSRGESLVIASDRLFRYASGRIEPVAAARPIDQVYTITDPEPTGVQYVGTDEGLWRYSGGALEHVSDPRGEGTRYVTVISDPDAAGVRLVAAGELFRLVNGTLEPVPGSTRSEIGAVDMISRADARGARLVATSLGLYRYFAGGLQAVPGGSRPRGASHISPDMRLLGSREGLFHYPHRPAIEIVAAPSGRLSIEAGEPTELSWRIQGPCLSAAVQGDFKLRDGDRLIDARPSFNPATRQAEVAVTLPAEGFPRARAVQLFALDSALQPYPVSEPVRLAPAWSTEFLLKMGSALLLLAHTLLFGGLVVAARWSRRASSMVLHPAARWFGLWWGFAIMYFAPLQRWLLRRWFDRRKRGLAREPVLSLPTVNRTTGETLSTDELIDRIGPDSRIWLEGAPGMGKTVLAREIERRFFDEAEDLGGALRIRRFIPLFIRLRAFVGAPPGEGDILWAARLAEKVLAGQGFIVDDSGAPDSNLRMIFGILERSQFVLLLDGANEVAWSEQIGTAAAARDRPGLFVTSQGGPPPGSSFEHWVLPKTIQDSILPLLNLWMGETGGRRLFERLQRSPLNPDIRSGYDLRLLQSLAGSGLKTLPETRIQLYETMVAQSFDGDLGSLADDLAAFAWELWLGGKRQFEKAALGTDLTDRLISAKIPLIRGAADRYEFMHDQIESYLAARHIFTTANPFGLVAAEEPRWRIRIRSEQADLWRFLRDMADRALAQRLYLWALEEPDDRIELQKAFRSI